MHIGLLNPQGNFDPGDSYWTEHPDFGGQLVYVKQVALAMAELGHRVDILTRQVVDPAWPEFAAPLDAYPGAPGVRIVRLPAGPAGFLPKERLWPHLVRDWAPNIIAFYRDEGGWPDTLTAHYGDGGLCAALIEAQAGVPFTFTAHSLGAQKMDKLGVTAETMAEIDTRYAFGCRLLAERLSMKCSAVNITSTRQERLEQYGHHAYRGAVDVNDDARFAVIPPGVNLAVFGADARLENEAAVQQHVRERLARDLGEERLGLPSIVASSRLDAKKNHLGLVQAFAHSPTLQQRANLVLITGALDDPLRDDAAAGPSERAVLAQLRRVVDEHNLWGKISAFGVQGQPALAAAYRLLASQPGACFALMALYEPFGLAPLEAAAAGLAVVVTQNGGPSESMREGEHEYGVLVDPADPADIASGLERIVCDAATWEQFARRGRQRVLDAYTWERTAQGYLAQLERITRAPRAARRAESLPLHPYFSDPRPENAVSVEELAGLYLGGK
ncbi:MAG: glycosyltransferase [Thermoflexales bacterium]|nr:glycosyltransferase [Thermoflexales bacterium]